MSLNWNVTKIKNSWDVTTVYVNEDRTKQYGPEDIEMITNLQDGSKHYFVVDTYLTPEQVTPIWNPITETIVWRMMATSLGWELTEANYIEFYARCKFLDKLDGTVLTRKVDPETGERPDGGLTIEEIRSHIGLSVNVSPEPASKWWARMAKLEREKYTREVEKVR
jgi:hypothetical protein